MDEYKTLHNEESNDLHPSRAVSVVKARIFNVLQTNK